MAPPPKKKQHTFKYQKAHDFKTIQIHGAYGGMNIRGQLNMNFYVETPDLVKSTTANIVNGKLGPEEFPIPTEQSSIREFQFGINIDIGMVKSTAQWMINHVEAYEKKLNELKNNNVIKDSDHDTNNTAS
jgi:hypothetical protein